MTSIPDEHPEQEPPRAPTVEPAAGDATAPVPPESAMDGAATETSLADDAMTLLSEHKGKLAIGVAATLGMMVYYGWREKRLAKTDPEEYARLQRLKAVVRHTEDAPKAKTARKTARPANAAAAAEADGSVKNDGASRSDSGDIDTPPGQA